MSPSQPPSSSVLGGRELHQTQDVPRQKRFKVGRACYTCRVKKIKCDGLKPCMQCKARRRPCSFSKDGSFDNDAMRSEEEAAPAAIAESVAVAESPPTPGTTTPSSPADSNSEREKNNAVVQRTTEILDRLSASWPGQGREGNWGIDQQMLDRDPLDNFAILMPPPQFCADMPPQSVQHKLLLAYFEHRHMLFPIISPRSLYDLLERPNGLITPLLLFSLFAHAAQCDGELECKADVYFRQAQLLLDDYLDIPRISTAAALCLLSLYEPKRNAPSRSSLYLGMASQMCADLGLLKRYGSRTVRQSDGEGLAWYSRVCWGCYCLDKMQSISTGRPWTMDHRDIDLDIPLPETEEGKDERRALEGFVAIIKLLQIYEQAADVYRQADALAGSQEHEQMTMSCDHNILLWNQSLPAKLQWTTDTPEQASHPLAAHLHLVSRTVALVLHRPYAALFHTTSGHRCMSLATQVTQLMHSLAERSIAMLSCGFAAYGVMAALRVHVLHCAHENTNVASNARLLFQQSLRALIALLQRRWVPGVERFVINLEEALSAANGTAFVVSHDDSKQQDWSKLDYLAHGVMVPSVKEANGKMSSYPPSTAPLTNSSSEAFASFTTNGRLSHAQLGMDFTWPTEQGDRMEPSSVDAFLYRARSMLEQRVTTTSAMLLDQQKLCNDSPGLSVLPTHQDHLPSSSSSSSSSSSLPLPWPTPGIHPPPPPVTSSAPVTTPQDASSVLYSMWSDQSQPQTLQEPQPSATPQPPSYFQYQPSYMNIGLGVYASAHQHHNDVIRHHFASNDPRMSLPSRPVIMAHHGHVVSTNTGTPGTTTSEPREC